MRRDMDLVRSILLKIEESELPYHDGILEIEGRSEGEITYHLNLLIQAGFVNALELGDVNTQFGYQFQDASLT